MLLGRDKVLGQLDARLAAAAAGDGSTLVVRGEPGIGKSSLLAAHAQRARDRGFVLLRTTGVEAETPLPYAGLQQLLRPVIHDADLLPAGLRLALHTAFGIRVGPPPELFAVAMTVLALITDAAARTPVAVVIDDLQWLDDASISALGFVARRVADDPVLVVATIRTAHRVPTWEDFADLHLPPLDDASARGLIEQSDVRLPAESVERILRLAGGNPLALVELPTVWQPEHLPGTDDAPLTARLERAFGHRTAELPADTRDVLLVASVDDEDDLGEILAAATVLSGRQVGVAALAPAERAGLVRVGSTRLRFRHPLIRSGVRQSEGRLRRHAANAALADILIRDPFRRSWYRSQSVVGPDDEVADALEANHDECIRRGSIRMAISALERAAELTADPAGRGRRLLLAAELAFTLGQVELVARLVGAAARTPLSALDLTRVEWLREIFSDGVPGDAGRVHQLCQGAAVAAGAGDLDLALNLLLGAALRCWWADCGPRAGAEVASTLRSLSGANLDARYVAALAVAEPVGCAADVDELLSAVVTESVVDPDALRLLGMAAHAIGDQPRAADFLERAQHTCRAEGRLGLLAQVLGMHGSVLLDLGDWHGAGAASAEGRRAAADTGQPIWSAGTLVNEARVAGLTGHGALALELADQADRSLMSHPLNDFRACGQLARGFALLSDGRYADAFRALSRVFDTADACHHQREQFSGIMFLAEAAVHVGEQAAARRVLADMEQLATITPSPLLRVQLLYSRAVLAQDADADRLFVQALAADLDRWPWVLARVELAYGSWLRRHRRVAESRQYLRSAHHRLEQIGAAAWAGQAAAELAATGAGRSTAVAETARIPLSAQELQIALLAADGLSNREIGSRLFLSHRTVGSHLYRIFPKLDISSRGQLAGRLAAASRRPEPSTGGRAGASGRGPASETLFGQPAQAAVGDVAPSGIDGQ